LHALTTALGVISRIAVRGVGTAAGVSALLTASTVAYTVLRLAGATYIIILGMRFLREVWRAQPLATMADADPRGNGGSIARAWRRGLLSNLANPKVGAFYVALLPQFIPNELRTSSLVCWLRSLTS